MADLAVHEIKNAVLNDATVSIAATAGAGGNTLPSAKGVVLAVLNGSGSSINVTVLKQQDTIFRKGLGDVTLADITFAVAAGKLVIYNPPSEGYVDTDGKIPFTVSAVTTVTLRAVKFINL